MENLRLLEESLFKKEYLGDREYLENIFDDNFMEYGKSGNIYYKEDTIESLYGLDDRNIKVENFSAEQIDTKTYMVHYVSVNEDGVKTLRTSIWIKKDDYKLLFHQGTKIN